MTRWHTHRTHAARMESTHHITCDARGRHLVVVVIGFLVVAWIKDTRRDCRNRARFETAAREPESATNSTPHAATRCRTPLTAWSGGGQSTSKEVWQRKCNKNEKRSRRLRRRVLLADTARQPTSLRRRACSCGVARGGSRVVEAPNYEAPVVHARLLGPCLAHSAPLDHSDDCRRTCTQSVRV